MDFKLMIIGVFIVLVSCIGLAVIVAYRYWLERTIQSRYLTSFQHEADMITLSRWSHHWDERAFDNFKKVIDDSRQQCKNETIVFVGLCQDNGRSFLPFWLPIIEKLGKSFLDYRIIFVENDSRDDTRKQLLQARMRNRRITILCSDDKPENTPECSLGLRSVESGKDKETKLEHRLHVIRHFREVYLNYVKKNLSHFDYMTVIDWDLMGEMSMEGFFHSLTFMRCGFADGVAVNSFYNYSGVWRVFDTFPMINRRRCQMLLNDKKHLDHEIDFNYRKNLASEWVHPVRMESAFGGIATYHIPKIMSSHYVQTEDAVCPVECEHTTFHRSIRMFIDPWFVLLLTKNLH